MDLNLKSISVFTATGFFLGKSTYFTSEIFQKHKEILNYKWRYKPQQRPLSQILDEFAEVFEAVSKINDKQQIILPLSGGLDSRTQAALLKGRSNVNSYSYSFQYGIDESVYGRWISNACDYHINEFTISQGYLWNKIETLAEWNNCESEFTHPRQMAIESKFPEWGDVFYLGHWGDVLFDSMGIDENAGEDELIDILKRKIIKKGGMELAEALWEVWDFPGFFSDYLDNELYNYLSKIRIDHAGAKIRAFKSSHWLPRWTMTNLCIFKKHHPIVLPFCDTRMFDFISSVPEEYLSGRKIQIEYIKRKAPELAKIPWQPYAPQNLYNYRKFKSIKYWSRRGWAKVKSEYNSRIKSKKLIQRNWELQFLGEENDKHLRSWLFENPKFTELVPQNVVKDFYNSFINDDPVYYSHPISMLLTLSVFSKKYL